MTDLSEYTPEEKSKYVEYGWKLPNGQIIWGDLPLLKLRATSVIDRPDFEDETAVVNRERLARIRAQYAQALFDAGVESPINVTKFRVVRRYTITAFSAAEEF